MKKPISIMDMIDPKQSIKRLDAVADRVIKSDGPVSVFGVFQSQVRKAMGEGTRGGKVIGHTKSGKPIYQGKSALHVDHKKWSKQDHKDASKIHKKHISSIVKNKFDLSRKNKINQTERIATNHEIIGNKG